MSQEPNMQFNSFPRTYGVASPADQPSTSSPPPTKPATSSAVNPSSASVYTEYSYDKAPEAQDKPRRSLREKVKGVLKDLGHPPTGDRQTDVDNAGRLASMPASRT